MEIDVVIKKLSGKESPEPEVFTGEFYQIFEEEWTPISLKLFQIIEKEWKPCKSFSEASVTLIQKPYKDITKKL